MGSHVEAEPLPPPIRGVSGAIVSLTHSHTRSLPFILLNSLELRSLLNCPRNSCTNLLSLVYV